MVVLYLPKTDERQFLIWLNKYCVKKEESNKVYKFSHGWNYKLYYPTLDGQNTVSFTARVFRAFQRDEGKETTETMANNVEAIRIEWQEVEDRLKVTISQHDGTWVMPPLNDLLKKIRANWPEAIDDIWS